MPENNTITLILDGRVSLSQYAKALLNFDGLIDALATELHSKEGVDWWVDELERSSARATIRGESQAPKKVQNVINAYTRVGRAMQNDERIPYSPRVARFANGIREVLGGQVTSVRFETADSDIIIERQPHPPQEIPASYGAVEGRIQTLSNRVSLRFTLFDVLYDRAVSCYLDEDHEDLIREAWGRRAVVEGLVYRDPETGRPMTVRRVKDIQILPDHLPSYRNARGAVPLPSGGTPPEEIIRQLRDG